MLVIDVALKDILQVLRDKKSALLLVLMPILFTLFFGAAFSAKEADTRLPVGWISNDPGGALGVSLYDVLSASDAIRVVKLEGKAAQKVDSLVQKENLAAAVIVPEGFSARAQAGQSLPLAVVAAPGSLAGQTATTAIQMAAKRVLGAVEIAGIGQETLQGKRPAASEAERAVLGQTALDKALAAWKQPALKVTAEQAASTADRLPSGFAQSSPGMMVQFAMFALITTAMVLVLERKSGMLTRMLTTPIRRCQVIAGHGLAMFGVVFLQELMLVILGQLGLGVNYAHEPLGTLVMLAALAIWAATLGLFIGSLARKEDQVVVFSLVAMFVFSALGGAWFPLEIAGKAFATVGHVLPTAWAVDGLQNVVLRGLGVTSTLLPAGMLLGYSIVFGALAIWRFRFE